MSKYAFSPEMQKLLDKVFPTLNYALDHPDDYFFMHPAIAMKVGVRMATVVGTMAFREAAGKLSNKMVKECFSGLHSSTTIQKYLDKLEKIGLITAHFMEPEEIVDLLKEKNLSGKGVGQLVCDWCGYNALSLDAHHYPEHKKNGGQDTVNICSNCHREYHYLAGQAGRPEYFYYKINVEKYSEFLNEWEQKLSPAEKEYQDWKVKRFSEISDGPYGELTLETESGPDMPSRSGANG